MYRPMLLIRLQRAMIHYANPNDPHNQERFRNRVRRERDDLAFWFPRPEDVIIQKLRWARKKDLEDIAGVLQVSGDRLDFDYIHTWCDRHGTRALLDEVRARPFE